MKDDRLSQDEIDALLTEAGEISPEDVQELAAEYRRQRRESPREHGGTYRPSLYEAVVAS